MAGAQAALEPPQTPRKDSGDGGFKGIVAVFVAAAAVAALGLAVVWMYRHLDSANWERAVYVFGAIQALAFAGAGYLWGREVNRGAAETATKQANTATDKAEANSAAATAGRALAALIRGKDEVTRGPSDGGLAASLVGGSREPGVITDLRFAADELFPPQK